ncbi:MAG: diguanylate cyclase [bacterium]
MHEWVKEFSGAVTVTDREGIILEMNDKAVKTFEADGGAKLIGTNVLDCHSESSRTLLASLMQEEQQRIYTIEKNGIHKLIYQTPWYRDGEYAGFVELSLEIPAKMTHHIRS